MNRPLISICIPTFNRAKYIRECLQSLTDQFLDEEIKKEVNVYILDNQSEDETEAVVRIFADKFDNIHYIKDTQNRKIAGGIISVASLADGEYIWVFSDDDIQTKDCLKQIINSLNQNKADLILCNIDSFVQKNEIYKKNLFNETCDLYFNNRSELLKYLNTKFYYDIDYFTTYCSNWILSKDFFDKTSEIFNKYNDLRLDLFPLPSLVFYSQREYTSKIIADSLVLFRADNASWGHKTPIKHFLYQDRLWRHHFGLILRHNKSVSPQNFALNITIKNLLRKKDLLFIIAVVFLKKIKLFEFIRKYFKSTK